VIAFNVFGLIAIPLCGWLGWWLVRVFWWRVTHLALLAVLVLAVPTRRRCRRCHGRHIRLFHQNSCHGGGPYLQFRYGK
jgi:hypothetical protein